eukprot:10913706-Alexandrium_andersonii.AAC.1
MSSRGRDSWAKAPGMGQPEALGGPLRPTRRARSRLSKAAATTTAKLVSARRKARREKLAGAKGLAAAFKALAAPRAPQVTYVADQGQALTRPHDIDRAVEAAWTPIFAGNGDIGEVACNFMATYGQY